MKGRDSGGAPAKAGATSLALACAVVWVAAAASARPLGIWLAVGGAAVALGAAVWLFDRAEARRILQPSPSLVLLGAAAGAVMIAATYLLYPVLARVAPFIGSDTTRLYAAFRVPSLATAAIAIGPVVLAEELVWRGVVQGALVRRAGRWQGVTLAAAAYALAHAPLGSSTLVMLAFACGLAPALVAHLAWDVTVLLWLPLPPA